MTETVADNKIVEPNKIVERQVHNLPIKEVFADPTFNCRGAIIPFDVGGLMDSIRINKLQQPIVVQPYSDKSRPQYKYRVIMGHRRHKACELLKFEMIPCIVNVGLTEAQARALNLIENLQRKDLTIMQEAKAIEKFVIMGIPQHEIGKMVEKSYGWIQIRIAALMLPPEIQAEIDAGFIRQEQIQQLAALGNNREEQFYWVKEIKESRLRGERKRIMVKARKKRMDEKVFERRPRSITEALHMQTVIRESIGNNLTTRLAAWMIGEINTADFYDDLENEAKKLSKVFKRPA